MNRFSRQKGLADFSSTSVLIVGVGGVGSYSAIQLAEMGVGRLILFDWDVVEECNLSRQPFFEKSVGRKKVLELKKMLNRINSRVEVEVHSEKFNGEESLNVDFVLDGSDNREARLAIGKFSERNGVPWIFCGVKEFEFMISTFIPGKAIPFSKWKSVGSGGCVRVTASTVMAASSLQVSELITLMKGKPNFDGFILYSDLRSMIFKKVKI